MNASGHNPETLHRQCFGAIMSREPLVTVSKRSHFHQSPTGIGPLACAADPAGPSLHFLFLAWSHEAPDAARAAAREIEAAFRPYSRARVVILANTADEARALCAEGLEAEEINLLLAVDETRYVIAPPDPGFPPCTAVYVAGLEPYKRHELAVGIDGLRLLYWRPSAGNLFRTRNLLPHADFTNHRFGGGPHALVTGARYCSAVQSARVGLCLSDVEGPMRASIEYALLGLPVISTSATGGRVEFMDQTHGRVVPPDADAIARAVAELTRDRTPAEVVTAAALSRLARERARFGEIAREWTTRLFSGPVSGVGDTHPRTWGLWTTRSAAQILQGP